MSNTSFLQKLLIHYQITFLAKQVNSEQRRMFSSRQRKVLIIVALRLSTMSLKAIDNAFLFFYIHRILLSILL